MSSTPTNLGRAPFGDDARLTRSRRGNLARLAMFLVASALLGHWQARQASGRTVVQEGVSALVAPLITVLSAAGNSLRSAAAAVPKTGELAAENQQLKAEIQEMRRRNAALAEAALERERLRGLLHLRSGIPQRSVAARVIGRRLSGWPEAIILDKGRSDGIAPRQAVMAASGLVGRIYSVSAHTALAVPLTDRNSAAGALLQRSRDAGILTGDGSGCELKYLPLDAEVMPGDVVVSSGLGGILPKGIMIGTVVSATRDDTASMKCARVRLSVNLSRLEEVLVLSK